MDTGHDAVWISPCILGSSPCCTFCYVLDLGLVAGAKLCLTIVLVTLRGR